MKVSNGTIETIAILAFTLGVYFISNSLWAFIFLLLLNCTEDER